MEKVCIITSDKKPGGMCLTIYGDTWCAGQKVLFSIWHKDKLVITSDSAIFSYSSMMVVMKLVERNIFSCVLDLDDNSKPVTRQGAVYIKEINSNWSTEQVEQMLQKYGLDMTESILNDKPIPYYKDYVKIT